MGTTSSQATNVSVNGTNALLYGDATFASTNMPLTTSYTAIAKDIYGRISTNTATVSLATNVSFQYDRNGNLTNDGTMSFGYDDENQLTQVWVPGQWFSQFTYDGKMRRRIRQEYTWSSGWVQTNIVYYVYDGNVVIQERDINKFPTATYTRGKDLSGWLQGAGGIGGLLARTDNTTGQPAFYHADGNGNVTMLVNSAQAVVAKYLYDAFGNTLSLSGPLAFANLYRFSSKETHQNSGLVYYLYRYYDPNLQRWVNRDPYLERGFEAERNASRKRRWAFMMPSEFSEQPNLYTIVRNDPEDNADPLGLGLVPGAGRPYPPFGHHPHLNCVTVTITCYGEDPPPPTTIQYCWFTAGTDPGISTPAARQCANFAADVYCGDVPGIPAGSSTLAGLALGTCVNLKCGLGDIWGRN